MKKILLLTLLLFAMASHAAAQESATVVTLSGAEVQQPQPVYKIATNDQKWRFSIDIAYTYRTAKAVETGNNLLDDYLEKMRGGLAYGGDIHYLFKGGYGLGLRFYGHHYSNSEFGLKYVVNTYHIGPSFIWRSITRNNRGSWFLGISAGYVAYQDEISATGAGSDGISSGCFGAIADLGYDIRLGFGNTFLGFRISFISGTVNMGGGYGESLNAVDIGMGLRF